MVVLELGADVSFPNINTTICAIRLITHDCHSRVGFPLAFTYESISLLFLFYAMQTLAQRQCYTWKTLVMQKREAPTVLRIDRTVTMYIICVPICIKMEADFYVKKVL